MCKQRSCALYQKRVLTIEQSSAIRTSTLGNCWTSIVTTVRCTSTQPRVSLVNPGWKKSTVSGGAIKGLMRLNDRHLQSSTMMLLAGLIPARSPRSTCGTLT